MCVKLNKQISYLDRLTQKLNLLSNTNHIKVQKIPLIQQDMPKKKTKITYIVNIRVLDSDLKPHLKNHKKIVTNKIYEAIFSKIEG